MKNVEDKILEYIYGEMTASDKKEFEKELKADKELAAEVRKLKSMHDTLRDNRLPESKNRIVNTAQIYNNLNSGTISLWKQLPVAVKAFSFVLIFFVVLSVTNFTVQYNDAGLTVKFGVSSSAQVNNPAKQIESALATNRTETLRILKEYIDAQQEKQFVAVSNLLGELQTRRDVQRRLELEAVYQELENLRINTRARFVNANRALNGLAKYVSNPRTRNASYAAGSY